MKKFEMIVPCLFGLEAFVSREVRALGIETDCVEDGRVCFSGGAEDMMRANLWLRTGERVLIKVCEFYAEDFDTLYNMTAAAAWSEYLPPDARLQISGHCLKSQLSSHARCRAIIKKAIADSIGKACGIDRLPEDGAPYPIRFSFFKNRISICIDTSGEGLHKRGYRRLSNAAPLRETIAAAMVYISRWRWEDELADPFCGSGTIPIEAAMIKRNIAPGLRRHFAFEEFSDFDTAAFERIKKEATLAEKDVPLRITALDTDPECVKLARENAAKAGVGEYIDIREGDAREFSPPERGGTIICNPPYGERLSDAKACEKLYREIGRSFTRLNGWSYFILAANDGFELLFGKPCLKKRKIYNGMLKCNIYQYPAPRGQKK